METVPPQEIECRVRNFQLCLQGMGLDGAFILQNVDLFYFSGTIQSSVLFIPQQGESVLMVQKGFKRARQESPLKHIVPVTGRGQIKKVLKNSGFLDLRKIGLEMDILAPRFNQRLQPGMVIALEPMFVFPGKGIVGVEDDYLVTTMGVERLTLTDQTVIKI